MAKLKAPLLSLAAHGTLAGKLTFQKKGSLTIARKKPVPADRKTLAQMYQRWDYQDAADLWHYLTDNEKEQWETDARPLRITGFNYWMRTRLNTLPDLAGRWRFDEKSGTLARDSSKNNNPGTVYGATHVVGVIDHALNFDNIDDYVNMGNPTSCRFGTGDFYIEATVIPSDLFNECIICYKKAGGDLNQYGFYIAGSVAQFWTYKAGYGVHVKGNTTLIAGKPYHIAGGRKGNTGYIYVNGLLDGTDVGTVQDVDAQDVFSVGRDLPSLANPFGGIIDNVIVMNRFPNDAEIKRHSERRYPL